MRRRLPHPSTRSSRGLSRRGFLGGAAALGVAGLAGCSSAGGFRSNEIGGATELNILTWSEYIDPPDPDDPSYVDTLSDASAKLGMSINYDESYEDNAAAWEDLILPSLSNGRSTGFDIIVPTYWLAARMIERGWAEQIPLEVVPNHVNIEPAFLTNSWDRGSRFQMPWQGGITGIAYDPARTGREIRQIADLFDPEFAGRVSLIVEMRETVGFAMLLNGDDPSRPTFATASAALDLLEGVVTSGQISMFTANEFADLLAAGDIDIAMAWSGDTVLLQGDRPDLEFVIPEEGAIQWFDTMVIPQGSPNVAAAGLWMNHVYEPRNAANITNWVQYISPVIGVQDALADLGSDAAALADNPILFPDDETKRRLFTWGSMDADDETELEQRFASLIG